MTRSMSSQISFADLEFLEQGVQLEPILHAISDFIDEHGHLVDKVRRDLKHHQQTFGNARKVFSADRSFFSKDNIEYCTKAGVELVCIPQRGGKKSASQASFEKS